ncbi:MAG: PRC-barrel domain-containing protein [Candidatus Bathyarchaeia archaeon]|nr:zinc-ribbon domain-containing protein [Candidatus Bathyarchaeota archaeon]
MSEKGSYISYQAIIGKQVVDMKGALIGEVGDLAFDFKKPEIILRVKTKTREEVEIPSSDVLSVEDLILLKKEVKLPRVEAEMAPPSTIQLRPPEARVPEPVPTIICPNCGARAPSRAKYCPKCGNKLK